MATEIELLRAPRPESHNEREERAALERLEPVQRDLADLSHLAARQAAELDHAAPRTEPFPVDLLPSIFADMVRAHSDSLHLPPDIAAIASLGVVSASAGKGIQAEFMGRRTRPNLFFLLGAESASGKSESVRPVIQPILDYQREKSEQWRQQVYYHAVAEEKVLEDRRNLIMRGMPTEADLLELASIEQSLAENALKKQDPYRLICEDASEDAFVERLAVSSDCTFSFSFDAGRVIDNLFGRNAGGSAGTDESHYLKAFTGEPIIKDRTGRRASSVMDPCAALFWMATPKKLGPLLDSDLLLDSGFLGRCLTAVIDFEDKVLPFEQPPPPPAHHAEAVGERLRAILDTYRFTRQPYHVGFERPAAELLWDFRNQVVTRILKKEIYDLREIARRWVELAARMALVLHVMERGSAAHREPIGAETAYRGVLIVSWFNRLQERRHQDAKRDAENAKTWEAWEAIQRLAWKQKFMVFPKNLYRPEWGWKRLCKNSREAEAILCQLVSMDYLEGPISADYPKNRFRYYRVKPQFQSKPARR